MTKRLERIFSEIPACKSFADVGCDHGFIAEKMLISGKCSHVTISDISEPSLQKAKKLLYPFIQKGMVTAICTDGLNGVDCNTDAVLIAGMGGEEIIKILHESPFLPLNLVLQPMKNVDKVRKELINLGYSINKDYLFYDKKYYNLLVCRLGEMQEPYTEKELIFGRDNLKQRSDDFMLYVTREIALMEGCVKLIESPSELEAVSQRIKLFKEVLNGN